MSEPIENNEKKNEKFPPWPYNKIIAGGPGSRFDFKYISEFNYEIWREKFDQGVEKSRKSDFHSIHVHDDLLLELIEKHYEFQKNGKFNFEGEHLEKLIKSSFDFLDGNKEWFIRMSYRSPKDVLEGKKPLSSLKEVVTAIIKSERCYDDMIAQYYHSNIRNIELPKLYIHFVPWRHDCDQNNEFRCFVHRRNLVAVTYQFPDQFEFSFKGDELSLVTCLNEYVEDLWKKIPNLYEDAIIDIEIKTVQSRGGGEEEEEEEEENNNNYKPILIEFNPYGFHGSTSAVLFDWRKDKDILYNEKKGEVTLRYSRYSSYGGVPFFKFQL